MSKLENTPFSKVHAALYGSKSDYQAAMRLGVGQAVMSLYLSRLALDERQLNCQILRDTPPETVKLWCQADNLDYDQPLPVKAVILEKIPFSSIHEVIRASKSNAQAAMTLGVRTLTLLIYITRLQLELNGAVLSCNQLRDLSPEIVEGCCIAKNLNYYQPLVEKVNIKKIPLSIIHQTILTSPNDSQTAIALGVSLETLSDHVAQLEWDGVSLSIKRLRDISPKMVEEWCILQDWEYHQPIPIKPIRIKKVDLKKMPLSTFHNAIYGAESDNQAATALGVSYQGLAGYINRLDLKGTPVSIEWLRKSSFETVQQWCNEHDWDYHSPIPVARTMLTQITLSAIHAAILANKDNKVAGNVLGIDPKTLAGYLSRLRLNGQPMSMNLLRATKPEIVEQWCAARGWNYYEHIPVSKVELSKMALSAIHAVISKSRHITEASTSLGVDLRSLKQFLGGLKFNGRSLSFEELRITPPEMVEQWCIAQGKDYHFDFATEVTQPEREDGLASQFAQPYSVESSEAMLSTEELLSTSVETLEGSWSWEDALGVMGHEEMPEESSNLPIEQRENLFSIPETQDEDPESFFLQNLQNDPPASNATLFYTWPPIGTKRSAPQEELTEQRFKKSKPTQ